MDTSTGTTSTGIDVTTGYVLNKSMTLDIDSMLKSTQNIKDTFNMEFVANEDNIALLNKKCYLMYYKILELESRIKSLEKR